MRSKLLALAATLGLSVCTAVLAPSVATAATPLDYYAPLKPMAINNVTGSGGVWISLTGNTAKFTLQVTGLLAGAPHAQQLWIGGRGACPTSSQATVQDGHESISFADETPIIGRVGTSLTTSGDTSATSALAMSRYPTAGSYTYTRTFAITPAAAAAVKNGTAVLVVHGIDYNHNGKYDTSLGTTPGDTSIPAEATDPALCGSFVAAQMLMSVPAGSAATGGGSAAAAPLSRTEVGFGSAALIAALGAALLAFRRRPAGQSAEAVATNSSRRIT